MLTLHNKNFTAKYGTINSVVEAFVEEERNGLFELSFIMLHTDNLFKYVKEDNIVVANANNTLLNQKFRIYMTRKLMNNRVEVFARHISFDLMYDYIDSISFENQSCEYALNSLFRGSQFSRHYKGYSDIINAQNYNMSMANILEAIGGKEGSILDTFGTGAELLRDNENIYVFNKRGHDNSVSIEYKKNLTGFELEEDTTDLVTRILPYARYTPEGGEEVVVKASFVDSPLIVNYSHPFVKAIDYTDKFEEGEEVTTNKLTTFAQNEYRDNKVDIPKQNFKIEFIPLSKCVGYEDLEDNISLCDTVTIKDTRYNINTQAKVIKTTFNVLKNRYESMELGEPRTSLGDIIGSNDSSKGEQGPPGPQGPPGADGSIGDFPNSLPSVPVVTAKVYGFANIEISWTFENKVYYQYEVYASKEANFTPNTFNLIHSGQTSTYMYQAKPNETWYFKVCAINTHGNRTDFGSTYASTTKIDDLSNYVDEMAINEALIGTLSLDRGWVGTLKGNYIDAKQLSVTDGNGKRTLDIDSYGNISGSFEELSQYGNNANKMISLRYGNLRLYSGQFGTDNKFLGAIGQAEAQNTNFGYGNVWGTANMATAECYFHDFAKDYNVSEDVEQAFSYDPFIRIAYENIHYQDNTTHKAGVHFFQHPIALHSGADFHSTSIQSLASLSFVNPYSRMFSTDEKLFVGGVQTVIGKTLGYTNISETIVVKDSALVDVNAILDMKNNAIRNVDEITANTITCYNPIIVGASISGRGQQLELYSNDRNFGGVKIDGSMGYFYPSNDNTMACGAWSNKWTEVIATKGVISTSDRNLKENIKYLNEEVKTIDDISVTAKDLYLFIKDDLRLANFDYKGNKSVANKQVGFIAQDIKNTKVGGLVVVKGENGELGYINNSYINIIAGALQYEINIRDKQIEDLNCRLEKIEQLILNKE